ncbi:DUF305 domain-containing protein [Rhodococcus triatomae]|uniref:Uncharacterized conserved protein, DUF305 family n=1 Tax=Rhodococcus triatomae TaxID=300028 RepID=A0A1G8F310_9NOCA|nr:DUF305 domain-containing protein [Rhodococcus triatomae]QNG19374.1 DUF305 domain-containing protein [Rhodococcus triatomae]QNG24713.1 DUF305 domain-containing protein [Rhodococcus triatomae]SDH76533.1 Uncharacterized conserved protein, DUF305 family [Rhodococcus triatomae]
MLRSITARWAFVSCVVVGALLLLVVGAGLRPALLPAPDTEVGRTSLTPTEIGFAQDMATHHEQAVFLVQNLGDDVAPEIAELGRRIASSQMVEIGTMRGWLTLVDEPWTSAQPMSWMHPGQTSSGHSHGGASEAGSTTPAGAMPGMASWGEINTLGASTGRDAEVRFLQLMARHHEGGIDMATAALESDLSDPVRRTVQAMVQEQTKELGYIGLLLSQRDAPPLPYP